MGFCSHKVWIHSINHILCELDIVICSLWKLFPLHFDIDIENKVETHKHKHKHVSIIGHFPEPFKKSFPNHNRSHSRNSSNSSRNGGDWNRLFWRREKKLCFFLASNGISMLAFKNSDLRENVTSHKVYRYGEIGERQWALKCHVRSHRESKFQALSSRQPL